LDQGVADIVKGEQNAIAARRATLKGQTSILNQQIAQFRAEITGLEGQVASADRRSELIEEEIKDVASLVDQGLARKARLLALERRKADIEGQRARYTAGIARAEQSIGEARLRINELHTVMRDRVVAELQEVQSEILDITERVRSAEDVMDRIEIKAPITGTVVNLQVHTASGVIAPGELLMEIVPRDDDLIIEARVSPDDIDVVRPGLRARVRFTAFNQRNTRTVEGEVLDVSADSLIDERTGYAYFLTRVKVTGDIDEALMGGQLYPGMQAQVMIVTGESTFLDYLLRPMERSFERAFREM